MTILDLQDLETTEPNSAEARGTLGGESTLTLLLCPVE